MKVKGEGEGGADMGEGRRERERKQPKPTKATHPLRTNPHHPQNTKRGWLPIYPLKATPACPHRHPTTRGPWDSRSRPNADP